MGPWAALRGAPSAPSQALGGVASAFRTIVPRLSRDDRRALHERLADGSALDLDFCVLIVASTGIATMGLLKDSGAVVIGAMLVAPLMTPMLGAGLALVQGNAVLTREAARSVTIGFCMCLATSLMIGWLVPGNELTGEMASRASGVDYLDLGIALASGFAAAWASARPGLMGALPGVAIAAALVPPVATVGLSVADGRFGDATRAASLFGINLLAIVFASAVALLALGVRPKGEENRVPAWATWGVFGFLLLTIAVSLLVKGR